MSTDPLCPQQHLPKHSPTRCIFCEYAAAVRADERVAIVAEVRDWCQANPLLCPECQDVVTAIRTRGEKP